MEEIERIQTELGQYLISIVPVPWEKICMYAECDKYSRSMRFAVKEKETKITVSSEFFFERYSTYLYKEMDTRVALLHFARDLYNAYTEKFGEDKVWRTMAFIIEEDGSFKIDFSYEEPVGDIFQERDEMLRKYFNTEYVRITGKYPSLT